MIEMYSGVPRDCTLPSVAIGSICFFVLNHLMVEGKTTPNKSFLHSDWASLSYVTNQKHRIGAKEGMVCDWLRLLKIHS